MPKYPETTLFMLMSLDGKISTGDNDSMDFDRDLPKIRELKEGVKQYYDLEKSTDLHSLNTGRVMKKIGANVREDVHKSPASFIIIDNKPHLTKSGVQFMTKWSQKLYLVTTNKKHPAFSMKDVKNMEIIYFSKLNLKTLFSKLKEKYGIDKITIQSGGTMNSEFIREGLIDHVSVVVAPCIIGGKNTSSLVDGDSLHTQSELKKIRSLKLKSCKIMKDSYLHLRYDVVKQFSM